MRFLVTGGAGFIGSNLALELESQGGAVVVLDDFSSGSFKNLIGFKGDFFAADIREGFDFLPGKFDAIFHEAAITDTTVTDQKKMLEVNSCAFKKLLAFAVSRGVKKIVYASSAGVYGNGSCPMSETQPPAPENVYGFSKAMMDNSAGRFAVSHHKSALIVGLRYFNVYGPRESHKGKVASMIYQLYLQMKAGKNPRVFAHGEQSRDFIYVKDVVKANLCALSAKESCVVNVGTGKAEDFNKVIECLNKALGKNFETEYFDNPYDFYQNKTQAETSSALAEIGFKAGYPLEAGISDYVKILEG